MFYAWNNNSTKRALIQTIFDLHKNVASLYNQCVCRLSRCVQVQILSQELK